LATAPSLLRLHFANSLKAKTHLPVTLAVGGYSIKTGRLNLHGPLPLARRHAAAARTTAGVCLADLEVEAHPKKDTDSRQFPQINVFAGEKLVFS